MSPSAPSEEIASRFGAIDIYLFDQIARGRFDGRHRVLDAGCGEGRNLVYLLQRDIDCFGVDRDPLAIDRIRAVARSLAPGLPADHFVVAELESLPHATDTFDAVICSAVLHFANDTEHFGRLLTELWRVLAPGGLLFARLASNIGIEQATGPAGRQVPLPDGTRRFIVDEPRLVEWTARLGGRLLDPIKTTNVQGMRAMTTWCVEKRAASVTRG